MGHVVRKDGIQPDPDKTLAVHKMEAHNNVSDLRRYLGMVNEMGKFSPKLEELSQPLHQLLSTKEAAFAQLKEELSKPTVLALCDPTADTRVSADGSSFGLGAVLRQKFDGSWKSVAYTSRSMTGAEGRYAQIEKEALATAWACDKFPLTYSGNSLQWSLIISCSSRSLVRNTWMIFLSAAGFDWEWPDVNILLFMSQVNTFLL